MNRRDYSFPADSDFGITIHSSFFFFLLPLLPHYHPWISYCCTCSRLSKLDNEMRTFILIVKMFVFYFLSKYHVDSFSKSADYYGLISSVHNYFDTSCVFLIHSRNETVTELSSIRRLMKNFSDQNIFVSSVEFRRLNETLSAYANRAVRALVVVSLWNHRVVAKFSNLTNYFDMVAPCWLLIFEEKTYLETRIHQAGENMFHLSFNTEMLVARSGNENIQEWYWLENRVKMLDLATWDCGTGTGTGTGFILKNNMSLYHRRSNLENTEITITTIDNPPMISFSNNTVGGLIGAILIELSRVANFNVSYVVPTDKAYGSWNVQEKRWTGMIQMLVTREATIAAAEFTVSTLRMQSVDFTVPLMSTRAKLYIRQPEGGIDWSAYWKALSPGIWIVVQILVWVTAILLVLMIAVRRSEINIFVFSHYLLLVFGICCQQGLPDFPTDLPSQIAFFSVFLSALICYAAYSGSLISFLTVNAVAMPFENLDGFIRDTTYNLIVYRDSAEYDMFATSTEPTLAKMGFKMNPQDDLPETLEDAFRQVCETKVAFYVSAVIGEAVKASLPCTVVGIDTERRMSLAMALAKGSPYNGLLNYHLQRFRDHGILHRLKQEYMVSTIPSKSTHSEVTVWGVIPIITVLVGGISLAILILCFEKMYHAKQSQVSAIGNIVKEKINSSENSRSEQILKIDHGRKRKHTKPSSYLYH